MLDYNKALVVDDSKLARFTLTKLLKDIGMTVTGVNSGEEALASVKQGKPEIIFMDYQMPGLDGYSTAKEISSDASNAHIPIIICTAQENEEEELKRAKEHGAHGLLKKPVTEEGVKKILQMLKDIMPTSGAAASTTADTVVSASDEEVDIQKAVDAFFASQADAIAKEMVQTIMTQLQPVLLQKVTESVKTQLHTKLNTWLKDR